MQRVITIGSLGQAASAVPAGPPAPSAGAVLATAPSLWTVLGVATGLLSVGFSAERTYKDRGTITPILWVGLGAVAFLGVAVLTSGAKKQALRAISAGPAGTGTARPLVATGAPPALALLQGGAA
jgi:hypothetical protein